MSSQNSISYSLERNKLEKKKHDLFKMVLRPIGMRQTGA